jgi:rhodanese-related sulfurtransferase
MSHKRIHPLDLMSKKTADMCILDVRTAAEVQACALPDCLHIPLHELTPARLQAEIAKSGKSGSQVYLLCQAGRRAEMAADQLQGNINAELVVIEGGMNAVQQSQIPLRQAGKQVMSLERQVRIAAGFLVVTGVVLGMLVSSSFYFLSGFVGAGLMFAGITDTCMMAMLIARMPWNK